MDEDEFNDDEEQLDPTEEIPPYRFSWKLVLADFLDNTGDIIEYIAEYPKSLCRRIWAHEKHKESRRLFEQEAAKEIEQLTGGQ